jgi:hypothetical protein
VNDVRATEWLVAFSPFQWMILESKITHR